MAETRLDYIIKVKLEADTKKAKKAKKEVEGFNSKLSNLQKKTKALQGAMFGMGLSFLFTGMAIKRVMDGIRRSSMDTFMKITQGQTEAGVAMGTLRANFEYLKYTVGQAISQALMPLIPKIVKIITVVRDWISDHPKLTTAILIFVTALALVMMIGGQLILFLLGFISFIQIIIAAVTFLAGIISLPFVLVAAAIVAVIAVIIGLIIYFREDIWNAIKWVWDKMTDFFSWIWDKLKSVGSSIKYFFVNVAKGIWDTIMNAAAAVVNGAIWVINKMIRQINRVPFVHFDYIDNVDFTKESASGSSGDTTINVYGAEGQSEADIASSVAQELERV